MSTEFIRAGDIMENSIIRQGRMRYIIVGFSTDQVKAKNLMNGGEKSFNSDEKVEIILCSHEVKTIAGIVMERAIATYKKI